MSRRAWDHKVCAGHFRHPAFGKRLCYQQGESEIEARAFADDVAGMIPVPPRRLLVDRPSPSLPYHMTTSQRFDCATPEAEHAFGGHNCRAARGVAA